MTVPIAVVQSTKLDADVPAVENSYDRVPCMACAEEYRLTQLVPIVTAFHASPEDPPEFPVVTVVPFDPPSAELDGTTPPAVHGY